MILYQNGKTKIYFLLTPLPLNSENEVTAYLHNSVSSFKSLLAKQKADPKNIKMEVILELCAVLSFPEPGPSLPNVLNKLPKGSEN